MPEFAENLPVFQEACLYQVFMLNHVLPVAKALSSPFRLCQCTSCHS